MSDVSTKQVRICRLLIRWSARKKGIVKLMLDDPFSNDVNFNQAFSRARVLVVRSQTSDGPKYWIAPG